MLDLTAYTIGANRPLDHTRILWQPIPGAVTADGAGGELAANDYTYQHWTTDSFPASWTLLADPGSQIDTVFIAGHNLGSIGATVQLYTSADAAGDTFTLRATLAPTDNDAIAIMCNDGAGAPHVIRRYRIRLTGGDDAAQIAIIRGGVALQMQMPELGEITPIGLRRAVTAQQQQSETGQWLGMTIQRQHRPGMLNWSHLDAAWYRDTFAPFADALPQTPFGLIQNAALLPESIAWVWATDGPPEPHYPDNRLLIQTQLRVTGYLG